MEVLLSAPKTCKYCVAMELWLINRLSVPLIVCHKTNDSDSSFVLCTSYPKEHSTFFQDNQVFGGSRGVVVLRKDDRRGGFQRL